MEGVDVRSAYFKKTEIYIAVVWKKGAISGRLIEKKCFFVRVLVSGTDVYQQARTEKKNISWCIHQIWLIESWKQIYTYTYRSTYDFKIFLFQRLK